MDFIHIPKTGGRSISEFFDTLETHPHNRKCDEYGPYVTVVREPISRFESIFRFWKYGSTECQRDSVFTKKNQNVTIKNYIQLIKTNHPDVFHSFTGKTHLPQIHWLPKKAWSHTVVIRYESDMSSQLQKFLEFSRDIVPPIKELTHRNVSHGSPVTLDDEDLAWLHQHYQADFELWDALHSTPELFKKVF